MEASPTSGAITPPSLHNLSQHHTPVSFSIRRRSVAIVQSLSAAESALSRLLTLLYNLIDICLSPAYR